ncbi:MAG: anti-sigma factor antagonist [Clostridia bacterium]|nr:anti-sigma factor antagonist [Clostridia bacterium]
MENVNAKTEGGTLVIELSGRVDSANAAAVEAAIAAETARPHSSIVIDAERLEYISSAGLRILLRIRKEDSSLKIVNVSSEVYEILDMTGFTEMITVEKAYRRLSVDGCEVIGQGANGKVFRLDPDTIIKVYLNPDSLPDIHRERELARCAFILGIPTAIPYDVVKVGDGYGSVFELLSAKSFAKLIKAEPESLDKYIGMYIDLLKKIHSTVVKEGDMPSMRDVAIGWAGFLKDYLPEETATKLVSLVEAVPEDYHMMHGDYHIKNVMLQNGEVLLIDMDTLCHGHPIFELASMFNAYCGFSELDHSVSMSFLGIPHETSVKIWEKSLPEYLGTTDAARIAEVEGKAKIIGYTRLMRRLIRRGGLEDEQGSREIATYKEHIIELVSEVDTLLF